MKKRKVTILYERLSRDDELQGPSNSILNQQQLLEEYAEKNRLIPYIHIQDDGYSGTNWNRPGWQELIEKVEADEVHCICIKDGTRLGRDYLRAGLYREMFRQRGIRLIAVNDGYDSASGEDDFTPFREIMAEFYARDTSKKIKTVLAAKGRSGKPTTNTPPYGYVKDPEDKYNWVVDKATAEVVSSIFQMAMDGMGPHQIARTLSNNKIERPSYYHGKNGEGTRRNDFNPDLPYAWRGSTVSKILSTLAYCGHMVNLRMTTIDFKTGRMKEKPKEEWLIFENRHEPIISQDVFDTVQKVRETPRRIDKLGYANPLTGLLWCADCGAKLYNYRTTQPRSTKDRKHIDVYHCSTYQLSKKDFQDACTVHHISTKSVRGILFDGLKKTIAYADTHEDEFVERVREFSNANQSKMAVLYKKQIEGNEKRIADLSRIFNALYEDKVLGAITTEQFADMSSAYEQESEELKLKTAKLINELDKLKTQSNKAKKFLELAHKYTSFEELTPTMINEFVDKIIVHEGVWSEGFNKENGRPMGTRSQQVDVYLKYIGKFEVPDMRTADEIEAECIAAEKLERKRQYNREYNRKRKAAKEN